MKRSPTLLLTLALAALPLAAFFVVMRAPLPAAAQVPDGFYISLSQDGTQNWAEGEWKTVSGANQDLNVSFYMMFNGDYQNGCIELEFEYEHDGETTATFWRGPVGVYMSISENEFNVTGQEMDLDGDYNSTPFDLDTSTDDVQQWFLKAVYPDQQHYYNLDGDGTGSATVCVTNSDDERPASIVLYNDDTNYYEADPQVISMRWFSEIPEPDEPIYCGDGIELISGTIPLEDGDEWVGNITTEWERLYVRYTVHDPNDNATLLHHTMYLNDEWISRRLYSDPYDGVDIYSYTVPNRTDPSSTTQGQGDYDKYGFSEGPIADLKFINSYSPVELVSACVLEAHRPLTPSAYCPNGLEMLEDTVYLDGWLGEWSTEIWGLEYKYVTVMYVVEPQDITKGIIRAIPGVMNNRYMVQAKVNQERPIITFTVPTSGVIKLYEDPVPFEFYNYRDALILHSVCVLDAQDSLELTEESCNLVNPDFIYGLGGWQTDGVVSWSDDLEDGTAVLSTGLVLQAVDRKAAVWTMQVRAKGDILSMGSSTGAMVSGGPQLYGKELVESFELYEEDIFVENGGSVQVAGEAIVDYVCLVSPDDAYPVPDCSEYKPVWDPEGSGDPLLIYLFKYVAEIVEWLTCLLIRAIALAANALIRILENIILRIPPLPNAGDGLISWLEWILLWLERFYDWIGINIDEMANWIPNSTDEMMSFLESLYYELIFWIADQLQVDPFWLLDLMDAIWSEALLFWDEITLEIDAEFDDVLLLLQNTANVLLVLVNGVRSGVSGSTVGYIGGDFTGVGAFIWEGVDFLNTATANTPLTALNLIAMGAIALTLMQWTIRKFTDALESLG